MDKAVHAHVGSTRRHEFGWFPDTSHHMRGQSVSINPEPRHLSVRCENSARVRLKCDAAATLPLLHHNDVGRKTAVGRPGKQEAKKLLFIGTSWQRRQNNLGRAAADGKKTLERIRLKRQRGDPRTEFHHRAQVRRANRSNAQRARVAALQLCQYISEKRHTTGQRRHNMLEVTPRSFGSYCRSSSRNE